MNDRLLTIAEYAKIKGVSQQAVYQQIKRQNSMVVKYVVKHDGKTFINADVLEELKIEDKTGQREDQPEADQQDRENNAVEMALIKQLEEMQKQLQVKDEQIAGLQKLLDQQQQLSLQDKQELKLMRERLALMEPEQEIDKTGSEQVEKKKSFFQRLFR